MAERLAPECTVCSHPQSAEIDAALLGGTAIRTIAGTFGLSRSAIGRHKTNHLTAEAVEHQADGTAELLLVDVHRALADLVGRLTSALTAAEKSRRPQTVAAISRELRQALEAIARLQADPELQRAASLEAMAERQTELAVGFTAEIIRQMLRVADLDVDLWMRLCGALLRAGVAAATVGEAKGSVQFRVVPAPAAEAACRSWLAKRADDQRRRVEAELQRRVDLEVGAELDRRLRALQVSQPALPAVPVHDAPVVSATRQTPLEGEVLPARSRPRVAPVHRGGSGSPEVLGERWG